MAVVWFPANADIGQGKPVRRVSAATTNAELLKGSAGIVRGWWISNTNAALRFVHLYDKATTPVPGTDTPAISLGIPANAAANLLEPDGIGFLLGIGLAMTTDAAGGNNPVAAGDIVINLFVDENS